MLLPQLLLIGAVVAVGVLHTIVPDHWVPITLIARAQGWSARETALAALRAGTGHVVSTLLIGAIVWIAGAAFATRFGNVVSIASSLALIGFGAWIGIGALRELRDGHGHDHGLEHHSGGHEDHDSATWHRTADDGETSPPMHEHKQKTSSRTALLLILGSSPMVEGIPAFFAAGKYGFGLIAIMSIAFAISTIVTYIVLCVYSTAGLQRVNLGSFEQYGEVISGAFIALVGVVFLIFPVL
jgi:ABC-type nickel/cobalt efflux system permease component RcnA